MGWSVHEGEMYLRHVGLLVVVLLGQEKLGFTYLHLLEPHLMEWYEVELAAVAQLSNKGPAPLRSMMKLWLDEVPIVKGRE